MFYIFLNPINVWLNKRQLDFHIRFCIQSVVVCFLVEVHEYNPASHRYMAGNGRSVY